MNANTSITTLPVSGKHRFGDPVSMPADLGRSRYPQTERTCVLCGVVKVTVHWPDGVARRAWRRGAEAAQIESDVTPSCVAAVSAP